MIVFHQNSGTFVDVIRTEGDVTLEAARAKLEAKSKDSSSTSNIRQFFPHARLANHTRAIVGEERGKFDELTMKAIIIIDQSQPNIALTKTTVGLFVWSDWTLSQLKKGLNSGELLHQRQIRLVILMFVLLLHLMQDGAADDSEGCLRHLHEEHFQPSSIVIR